MEILKALTDPLPETNLGWCQGEIERIERYGGKATSQERNGKVSLMLISCGPDFQPEKWPSCMVNLKVSYPESFRRRTLEGNLS